MSHILQRLNKHFCRWQPPQRPWITKGVQDIFNVIEHSIICIINVIDLGILGMILETHGDSLERNEEYVKDLNQVPFLIGYGAMFVIRGQIMTYDTLESIMHFQASTQRSSIDRTLGQRFRS